VTFLADSTRTVLCGAPTILFATLGETLGPVSTLSIGKSRDRTVISRAAGSPS
jgi:hypothetical protein